MTLMFADLERFLSYYVQISKERGRREKCNLQDLEMMRKWSDEFIIIWGIYMINNERRRNESESL